MLLAATLLRRHFQLVHLALLAVAALLAVRFATTWSSLALAAIAPASEAAAAAPRRPTPPIDVERPFEAALGASMFGISPDPPTAVDDDDARSCAEAEDTELPLRLVGAAVFVEPSLGLASIVVDEGRGALAEVYAVGALVAERARVVEIGVDHACVENLQSGAFERVTTAGPAADPRRAAATPRSTSKPGPTGDRLLDELMTGARVLPRFENGKITGVKLSAIKPGSLYANAGLKNGDVVVAVNGHTAEDPGRALELWARLKDQPTLEVSLLRAGAPLTLTVAMPAP